MSNVLFLSSRYIDAATMTASSEQGTLAASYVKSYRPDKVWRATGCTAEWIAWDFGTTYAANAAAIIAHNLSASATIRMRLASTAPNVTAAPAVDTGAVSAWPVSGKPTDLAWPSYFSLLTAVNSTGYQFGRIDIADASNTDGYVQIGRLMVGPSFVPTANVDINPSLGLSAPGEAVMSTFGRTFLGDRGPASRVMQLPFSAMNQTELLASLMDLERYAGIAKDFAFCLDPAATTDFHRFSMQARFESLQVGQALPWFNSSSQQVWQTTLTIAEVL